ncbi:MAG: bifunctional 4-hydroxy-2-oxoglutarate aldolase/2-dehydro-3-deoxy-phosphogluconate aldolase [Lentisphaerae bacterium]|nr:bifunctional 4-hydroxy-2-oxoglutarate aldolase/2-dehydro-3-deoxy-phosphogluconate aldolase [Lentisphaerota bacterium]
MNLLEFIRQEKFIVIARQIPEDRILHCAEAAVRADVKLLEVTFDPSDPETLEKTPRMLNSLRSRFEGVLRLGAGTVLNTEAVRAACQAGAEYLLSPNTDEKVVALARELGMLPIPGAYTPCEIAHAWECGAGIVKIFPVLPGGHPYVKVVMSPLSHIPFMVTGGVTPETVADMLSTGACALGAGASIFRPELVRDHRYKEIELLASAHLKVLAESKGE